MTVSVQCGEDEFQVPDMRRVRPLMRSWVFIATGSSVLVRLPKPLVLRTSFTLVKTCVKHCASGAR